MPLLPAHLAGLQAWIGRVPEVVVVDSESSDGTPEAVRAGLAHPGLRVLDHPPGLYASWNFGVGRIESPFTYIATVGDAISEEGLAHLVEVAETLEADVVISPPAFREAGSEAPADPWPIHALLSWLGVQEPTVLAPHDVFWLQRYYKGHAILGSSASDLYRTACLRERPFPVDCGRSGDAGWSLAHAHRVRIAVTPRCVSTFLLHPRPDVDQGRLDGVYEESLDAALVEGRQDLDVGRMGELRRLLDRLRRCEAGKARAKERLEARRRASPMWAIDGEARRARAWRNRMRRLRKRLIGRIEATCLGALPPYPDAVSGWL